MRANTPSIGWLTFARQTTATQVDRQQAGKERRFAHYVRDALGTSRVLFSDENKPLRAAVAACFSSPPNQHRWGGAVRSPLLLQHTRLRGSLLSVHWHD